MKFTSTVVIILSIVTIMLSGYKVYQSLTHPFKYESEIIYFSNKYNISPALAASVINVESRYNKNAYSNKKAIGLMQVKLSTANYLNKINKQNYITEQELFEASNNIKYGCMYLNYLKKKFEHINTVLAAYNAGETNVRNWLKNLEYSKDGETLFFIPYKETRNYIKKINNNLKIYKKYYK